MKPSRAMTFGRYDYAAFACFAIYASGSVIVPVALVLVARELGFSLEKGGMAAGGALHLGRTVPMVVSMLLSGFVSGWWGKRRSLGAAVMLMGIGVGGCALAPSYWFLFVALILAGFGEGIIEGIATPFVQDLHLDAPGRYINFSHSFWSVGVFVTVLLSGVLLSMGLSWRWVIGGIGALALLPAALLLLPSREGHHYPEHPDPLPWRTVLGHATQVLPSRRFWVFFAAMFLAGGGEFCLTFWSASYIQLHFTPAAWAGGVGTAFFAAGMVLGRIGWGYLIDQHHLGRLVIISGVGGALVTLPFPILTNLWVFFGLLFLAGIATAPYWPSIQSYATSQLPEVDTTMLLIMLSCAGVPGCGVFAWLMGVLGNRLGLNVAFYLVPACYITLAALIAFESRHAVHKADVPVSSTD